MYCVAAQGIKSNVIYVADFEKNVDTVILMSIQRQRSKTKRRWGTVHFDKKNLYSELARFCTYKRAGGFSVQNKVCL
jgi:hypothetical protein